MSLIWHLIQIAPSADRRALTGLRENGFSIYQPLETVWGRERWGKKRERINRPLLPGYVFLSIGPDSPPMDLLHDVDGVLGPVRTKWPEGFTARAVYDLKARELAGEFDQTPGARGLFAKGRKAKILSGPFEGKIGEMLAAEPGERIKLLVSASWMKGKVVVAEEDLALV